MTEALESRPCVIHGLDRDSVSGNNAMVRLSPLLLSFVGTVIVLGSAGPAFGQPTPVCGYEVVNTYPHDPTAYTQGLVYLNGTLYESTGLYGDSSLRRVDLTTGVVQQSTDLSSSYFGEGIAVVEDTIVMLTWQNHTGFLFNRSTFSQIDTFSYTSEGWGLAYDGTRLIRSDGTATIDFWDPVTLLPTGSIAVTDGGIPLADLNELEYIAGEIFANVWYSDPEVIARIDPATGTVTAKIDLTGLLATAGPPTPTAEVLNGIAFDATGPGRLFVTGKRWPWLFEIRLPDCPLAWVFGDGFESGTPTAWTLP